MSPTDKPLPQNLDAEKAILATILFDSSLLSAVLDEITAGDFFLAEHRIIFRCMLELRKAEHSIDPVTLCEALTTRGELDRAGGQGYVLTLGEGLYRLDEATAHSHARIIRHKSQLRALITASDSVMSQAYDRDANVDELHKHLRSIVASGSAGAQPKVVGGNGHLDYSLDEFVSTEFPAPEHLVEQLLPRNGSAMIVAMPHHLKSWFTTALALACTRAGEKILGKFTVKKPVRTLLVQVEEFPAQLQERVRALLAAPGFQDCDRELVRIIPRHVPTIQLPEERSVQILLRVMEKFKPDLVVLDVLRRIMKGDVNSPVDSSAFLESVDRLREVGECAVLLVHHENRKEADILHASAGSYNFVGWANSVIQFKRKSQQRDGSAHVELEVDNKLAPSPEPMRMVLDLALANPVRLESLEDLDSVAELREKLGDVWNVNNVADALGVHRTSAQKRILALQNKGIIERVTGRRGQHGLASYHFVGEGA